MAGTGSTLSQFNILGSNTAAGNQGLRYDYGSTLRLFEHIAPANAFVFTGSLTVITGSAIEFQVTTTGVKIGNSTADSHTVTGSFAVSGSNSRFIGPVTMSAITTYVTGALGVGTDTPTTVGLIRATNDVVAFYSSDERLKDNKLIILNSLDKVSQLSGYEFDWIPMEGIHENEGHDIGVIAQEVEKVFPEIVTTRDNGYKAVKYEKLTAVLIEAVKELTNKVQSLEDEINKLKNK